MPPNRHYRSVNYTIIGLVLFFFALPFLSKALSWIYPDFVFCQYRGITGNPCPFCGITRDLDVLFGKTGSIQNPFTLPLSFFLVGELLFRTTLLFLQRAVKSKALALWDMAIHGAGLLALAFWVGADFLSR